MPLSLEMRKRIMRTLAGKYNNTTFSSVFPGTIYLGLSSTAPNADGTNVTEPEGNGYQRMRLDGFYTLGMEASSTDQSTSSVQGFPENPTYDAQNDKYSYANDRDIYFVEPTGSWGTLGYFVLYNMQKGQGTSDTNWMFAYGQLITPITPVPNTIPVIRAGDLIIEEQ